MKNRKWKIEELQEKKWPEGSIGEGKTFAFLCLPFEGDLDAYAEKTAAIGGEALDRGFAVAAPYLCLRECPGIERTGEFLLNAFTWRLIERCDEFWVVRDMLTPNVLEEMAYAMKLGKKIRYVSRTGEKKEDGSAS